MSGRNGSGVLPRVNGWEVPHVAVAAVGPDGEVLEQHGLVQRSFRIASVSKLLSVYALLLAVEEEAVGLDDPVGPDELRQQGATLRHLLAHTSGLGFEASDPVTAAPGTRRIYSNAGIEVAAEHLEQASGIGFAAYLDEAVLVPLGMTSTRLDGSPAHDVHSTVEDLVTFTGELLDPRLLAPATLMEAVSVQFPGVAGTVPGVGRFDPCDWGYGFERNFGRHGVRREPHWAGDSVSTQTYGHFGGAGTFLWVDPVTAVACICLTDRDFGPWAMQAWPELGAAVVSAYGRT